MSGEVNCGAGESGSRQCLTEAKELFFRAGESVGEQRDWMRAGVRGEELKRRRVPGEGHSFDPHAWLDTVGQRHTCDDQNSADRCDAPPGRVHPWSSLKDDSGGVVTNARNFSWLPAVNPSSKDSGQYS